MNHASVVGMRSCVSLETRAILSGRRGVDEEHRQTMRMCASFSARELSERKRKRFSTHITFPQNSLQPTPSPQLHPHPNPTMKFLTQALIFLATATIAQAATCSGTRQCQCLFNDGSHCCVYLAVRPSLSYQHGEYSATPRRALTIFNDRAGRAPSTTVRTSAVAPVAICSMERIRLQPVMLEGSFLVRRFLRRRVGRLVIRYVE